MLTPQLSFSKAHIPANALPPLRDVKSHAQASELPGAKRGLDMCPLDPVSAVFAEPVPVYLFSARLPLKRNVEPAYGHRRRVCARLGTGFSSIRIASALQ